MSDLRFTRRNLLWVAGAATVASLPVTVFAADFWNKKQPSEWSREEVDQLLTKSPWARQVTAQTQMPQNRGGYGGGGGMGGPRIGGMGRRGGMGRGGGRRMPTQDYKGTVRWESAQPILEARKEPLPKEFDEHYVISVSDFPLDLGRSRRRDDESDAGNSSDSSGSSGSRSSNNSNDHFGELKYSTSLTPKNGRRAQPGVIRRQVVTASNALLFGFSKELIPLSMDEKEAEFVTRLGRLEVKARFNFKDMLYRGKLAV